MFGPERRIPPQQDASSHHDVAPPSRPLRQWPVAAAFGFLTVVGRGSAARPDRHAVAWFPLVGAVVGAVVGAAWWGAAEIWPLLLAAVVAVAVDAGLTGMLHLDGLADSADGLLPPMEQARRLDVMADPTAGAFAVVAVVVVLLLRVGAFTAVDPEPLAVAGIWTLSRTAMGLTLATVPYARSEGGLASAFVGLSPLVLLPGGLAGVVLVGLAVDAGHAAAAIGALVAGTGAVVLLARRRIGGFTGDVLGAAGVVGETCALLAITARW